MILALQQNTVFKHATQNGDLANPNYANNNGVTIDNSVNNERIDLNGGTTVDASSIAATTIFAMYFLIIRLLILIQKSCY